MSGWPQGYGRRVLAEVDSTNAEAARMAATLAGPEWILGLHQSAARGRRGRPWAFPRGNFAASLVMRPSEPPGQVALRSFVASLAVFDTCVELTGRAEGLALKWPNDVLLNGGKLAGILLESAGAGPRLSYLAIGIGVNLVAAPDPDAVEAGALRPVSLLSEAGIAVAPEAFLETLARAYAVHEARFVGEGFAPVRAAWLARAARLGARVVARTQRREVSGIFETVDAEGNLVLSTPQGRHAIPAAEIYF